MKGTLNGIIDIGHSQHLLTIQTSDDVSSITNAKDKVIDFAIRVYKPTRSRSANNYLWWICTAISNVLPTSPVEVYRDAIQHKGVAKEFHNLTEEECTTLEDNWSRAGIGWFTERVDYEPDGDHIWLRCYMGSSTYNQDDMKQLLRFLEIEAKNVGVNVDSDRIKSLLNDWDKYREV